jgi:hypothetical protein
LARMARLYRHAESVSIVRRNPFTVSTVRQRPDLTFKENSTL